MNLALGTTVRCSDGAVRELADIVVDGPSKRVTHLVLPLRLHHEVRHAPAGSVDDDVGELADSAVGAANSGSEREVHAGAVLTSRVSAGAGRRSSRTRGR